MIYGTRMYAFNESNTNNVAVKEANVEEVLDNMNQSISYELEFAMADPMFAERLEELYEAEINAYYDNMVLFEGANTEYTEIFKKHFAEYKEAFKAGKAAYKNKKYGDAKKSFNKAASAAGDILKDIKKVTSDNLGSAVCGYFIASLIAVVNITLSSLGPLAIVGYPGTLIKEVHEIINLFKSLIKDKDKLAKGLNLYKNQLETAGKFLKQIAEMAAKKCDENKNVKESYDACSNVYELMAIKYNEIELQEDALLESLVVQEGATTEYIEIAKKQKAIYKEEMKAGKAAFKDGKSAEAKKHYLKAVDACETLEKNFKKVTSDDIGSVLSGLGLNYLWAIGGGCALTCISYLAALTGVGAILSVGVSVLDYGSAIQRMVHFFKNFDTDNLAKSFNAYKNNVEYGFGLMKRIASDAAKKC